MHFSDGPHKNWRMTGKHRLVPGSSEVVTKKKPRFDVCAVDVPAANLRARVSAPAPAREPSPTWGPSDTRLVQLVHRRLGEQVVALRERV